MVHPLVAKCNKLTCPAFPIKWVIDSTIQQICIRIIFRLEPPPVLVTLCKDHSCTKRCITAALNETNYMPEGAAKESYWSLKVENPYRETHVYVTKHHYCSFYGGKKIPVKKQPQKAAVLIVAAGDNRCYDVETFGQNRGKTVIKSVCVANPDRLRPGHTAPPKGMGPVLPANQPRSDPYDRWL